MLLIPTDFVPFDLDATRFEAIEPYISSLLKRPVSTVAELEKWIEDRSELAAAAGESKANLYISMTCNTEDVAARDAYLAYVEHVAPKLTPLFFELDRRLVELADRIGLPGDRYEVLLKGARTDVALFRQENVPLETELAVIGQKYETICGTMTVQFDGEERTLPQMARYQELTDRALRERAWRTVADRRMKEADAIDGIYDQMVDLRTRVARNAGFKDFVPFAYQSKHRFDYGPEHCRAFHDACEQAVVPLVRALEKERKQLLGVDELRPWDLSVDVKGRGPLRPFAGGKDLMAKSLAAFRRLSPDLAALFAQLGDGSESRGSRDGACLDLDTRKGKAPGGYQYMRDRSRRPFIFMNAAGLQRDVETMVHEAGHAFHSMLCREEPLVEYRGAPIEFCEVASMTMELLTMPHWQGTFYDNPEEFRRACRQNIKSSVMLLPWIAQIDAFQHWVYANPKHGPEDRRTAWRDIRRRFGGDVDWSGLDDALAMQWIGQDHLFQHAFYYVEYAIAQIAALQVWARYRREPAKALADYEKGLALGGSRPLPELFAATGVRFDLGSAVLQPLVDDVLREIG
jgi:oligoendopeptidase F